MQDIFRRYEKKYLITRERYAALSGLLSQHMEADIFGEYLVRNVYFDTDGWDVVRASIARPLFKEKMRLRSYGEAGLESDVFLELKKKYDGVVYKRRIAVPAGTLAKRSVREVLSEDGSQIAREIGFYMESKAVSEKAHISFKRTALAGVSDTGLRVTFDEGLRFRLEPLELSRPETGAAILPEDILIMEIKTFGGIPIWLARALCENGIFPTTFSKYGACYTEYILKNHGTGGKAYAGA